MLRLLLILSLCAQLSAADFYTPSPSPFPGFIELALNGDARESVHININTIVEIKSDGHGCVLICDIAGQRQEFPTRMLAQQMAQLIAQAKR